jgi:lysyl-tRNA synthetase class 2
MENTHLSEQEQIRRNALKEIENLGIDPYPAAEYPVDTTAEEILSGFDAEKNNYPNVTVAGRIMSRRIMGAASFMVIQDHTGRIQVYLKRDDICPTEDKTLYNMVFKKLLDIGDIVGVKGYTFITQTGELTIHAKEFTLLSPPRPAHRQRKRRANLRCLYRSRTALSYEVFRPDCKSAGKRHVH